MNFIVDGESLCASCFQEHEFEMDDIRGRSPDACIECGFEPDDY